MADMFWGTIKVDNKTYAIVGGEGAIEAAKKALGTVSAVNSGASSAPLPVAPLTSSAPVESRPPQVEAPKEQPDVSAESTKLARGDRPKTGPASPSRWAMVRTPRKPEGTSA